MDIVVIESDKAYAKCVRDILDTDNNVVVFDDAREGLRYMEQTPPDVLVMDIDMPELDGRAMCDVLRRSDKLRRLPVVLIGGDSNIGDFTLYFKGVDLVTKPINSKELNSKVKMYYKLKQIEDSLKEML